jgi:Primase C terminal 2 (PriCT-2)/RepB DNA-primase from phage plasmid
VESSPGKFHEYILASDHWPADDRGSADHRAIEERMIESYGSDPNAKDLSRVLRVPGFLHRKDRNNPHLVRIVASPGWRYPRQQIVEAFPSVERSRQTNAKTNGAAPGRGAGEDQRIRDALFSIDATERHVWLTMGMAIEAHYGDAGRSLWDEWSLTAMDKYNERDQDRTWRSFKGSGVTIATLFHYAKHGGWEDGTEKLYEEWCRKQAPPKDDEQDGFANGILVRTPACQRRANGCSALRSVGHS